jgi:hypothetical protein
MQILKNKLTERKDSGEISVHLLFELKDLKLSHLILGMVEDFLTQHLQNIKIVLADIHILRGGLADIVDE